MKEFKYVVTDPVGIHARPAGVLVQEVKKLADTKVTIVKGDKSAEATKLLKIMGLGVKQGDEVTVQLEGGDEDAALATIEAFFKANF